MRAAMQIFAAGLALATSHGAGAAVVTSSAHGFVLSHSIQVPVPPATAFEAFGQMASWWDPEHSYSGDSANLSFALRPGGCFCERLPAGGGVEHLRVSYVAPGERAVLTGSLGPLLFEATTGVLDVKVARVAGGSRVTFDYAVSGFAKGGADRLAAPVDRVLAQQVRRDRAFAAARPRTN